MAASGSSQVDDLGPRSARTPTTAGEGRRREISHQPRRTQEVLQLPGDWPPLASVPVKDGWHIESWQAEGGESLRLLVEYQHRGVHQHQGQQQEATTAKEAPNGQVVEGRR